VLSSLGGSRLLLRVISFVFVLNLILPLFGCSQEDKAIPLVQNYRVGGKTVSERLSHVWQHFPEDKKVGAVVWSASQVSDKVYRVVCSVNVDGEQIHYTWLANLSTHRISPLDVTTQEIMGGGIY